MVLWVQVGRAECHPLAHPSWDRQDPPLEVPVVWDLTQDPLACITRACLQGVLCRQVVLWGLTVL